MNLETKIKLLIHQSPLLRTLVDVFSLLVFSILSGWFMIEITENGQIMWSMFYKSTSFYLMILSSFLMYFYLRLKFDDIESTERYKDKDYCLAFMRKHNLPAIVKRQSDIVKNGKTGELKNLISELGL